MSTTTPWDVLLADVTVGPQAAEIAGLTVDWGDLDADARRARLVRALYEHFHVGGTATLALQADEHYCASLAALHPAAYVPEEGWAPVGPSTGGTVRVRRSGVTVDVPATALREGAVQMPPVRWRWTLGFLAFLSSHGRPSGAVSRFYLHLTRAGVRRVCGALLAALEADGRPYVLKTANNPRLLELRRDATVLYAPFADAAAVWAHLRELADGDGWLAGTSHLARGLAPGISWGLEPTDPPPAASSFGLHRADLLASYLLGAGTGGGHSLGEYLREHGIDPGAPHVELGVADDLHAVAP